MARPKLADTTRRPALSRRRKRLFVIPKKSSLTQAPQAAYLREMGASSWGARFIRRGVAMVRSARWTLPLALGLALIGLPGRVDAQQIHKVVTGETLWGLSQRYYSDPYKWPQIYEANRAGIQD